MKKKIGVIGSGQLTTAEIRLKLEKRNIHFIENSEYKSNTLTETKPPLIGFDFRKNIIIDSRKKGRRGRKRNERKFF